MKFKKFILSLLLATLPVTNSVSAEALNVNLEDCLNLALTNNRSIEQSSASRENAQWLLKRYRRATGLSVSWSSNVNRIGGNDYITQRNAKHLPYNHSFDNNLRFTYPLYTGGRNENNIKVAQYNLNSADLAMENTRQQVIYNTTVAYYDILRNRNLVAVNENNVRLLNEHLEQVKSKFEIGVVAGSDILASQVQLANAEQNLTTARNNYENSVATLNNLMGVPLGTDLIIAESLNYTKYNFNLEECIAYALENRPDGIAASYAVQQAEKNVEVVRANKRPQVNAVVSRTFNGEKVFDNDHNDSWSAGFSMSWSVFDNNVTNAQ
ncbi:MAG: TolC family protein, partial [Selenomonadaceae bacterium]|nr:TolC family protein [Selenomonadaceae bacterium]